MTELNQKIIKDSGGNLNLMDFYDELIALQNLDGDWPASDFVLNLVREELTDLIKKPR